MIYYNIIIFYRKKNILNILIVDDEEFNITILKFNINKIKNYNIS